MVAAGRAPSPTPNSQQQKKSLVETRLLKVSSSHKWITRKIKMETIRIKPRKPTG